MPSASGDLNANIYRPGAGGRDRQSSFTARLHSQWLPTPARSEVTTLHIATSRFGNTGRFTPIAGGRSCRCRATQASTICSRITWRSPPPQLLVANYTACTRLVDPENVVGGNGVVQTSCQRVSPPPGKQSAQTICIVSLNLGHALRCLEFLKALALAPRERTPVCH